MAPVVPHGNEQWFDIVNIVRFGLINAEELGITWANVDTMMKNGSLQVKRLVGAEGD